MNGDARSTNPSTAFVKMTYNLGVSLCCGLLLTDVLSSNTPSYKYSPMHRELQILFKQWLEIPPDIPNDTSEITIHHSNIAMIHKGPLSHLKTCIVLDLMWNQIMKIQSRSFEGMDKLETLQLGNNKIEQLDAYTFVGLLNLKILHLAQNHLRQVHLNAFHDLRKLIYLILDQNYLTHLVNGTLSQLRSLLQITLTENPQFIFNEVTWNGVEHLQHLSISRVAASECHSTCTKAIRTKNNSVTENSLEKLKALTFLSITGYGTFTLETSTFRTHINLEHLVLRCNQISDVPEGTFSNLKKLNFFDFSSNCLSVINNYTFSSLTNLAELNLGDNQISHVDKLAFKKNTKLHAIELNKNKLSYLHKDVFEDLHLTDLYLSENRFSTIEPGLFSHFHRGNLIISQNPLHSLGWDIFVNNNVSMSHNQPRRVNMFLDARFLICKRQNCWIFDGMDAGWLTLHIDHHSGPQSTPLECRSVCALKENCMPGHNAACLNLCTNKGYDVGRLQLDYHVCPFQYYCNCTCPKISDINCKVYCDKKCKTPRGKDANKFECPSCECQCKDEDCESKCSGRKYEMTTRFGCNFCKYLQSSIKPYFKNNNSVIDIHRDMNVTETNIHCTGGLEEEDSSKTKTIITSLASLTTILIVAALMFHCVRKRRRLPAQMAERNTEELPTTEVQLKTLNLSREMFQKISECWIQPNRISTTHLIGRGNFGVVWSGTLQKTETRKTLVALKQVRESLHSQSAKDLLTESLIMRRFNHPNVLKLIGISVLNDLPCAILPLMINGDLKTYLRRNNENLTLSRLFTFARGIANGMNHLAEQNFVHRDLAARNCLINTKVLVKISDFGLTRDMDESDYYRVGDTNKGLPVRWMSLEAVKNGVFTTQSDVWSYGVVLWEIFTKGKQPYIGIRNEDIGPHVMEGKRLLKPEMAPEFVYNIMLKCWDAVPNERPTFTQIVSDLDEHAEAEAGYVALMDEEESD